MVGKEKKKAADHNQDAPMAMQQSIVYIQVLIREHKLVVITSD